MESLGTGLHLDDFRKFYEDPDGGRDYEIRGMLRKISSGDATGLGYEFASSSRFFTYNGVGLQNAFSVVYIPWGKYGVYAAVGVEQSELEVNFGTGVSKWKGGDDWAWRVEGHVGNLAGSSGGGGEELPSYQVRSDSHPHGVLVRRGESQYPALCLDSCFMKFFLVLRSSPPGRRSVLRLFCTKFTPVPRWSSIHEAVTASRAKGFRNAV